MTDPIEHLNQLRAVWDAEQCDELIAAIEGLRREKEAAEARVKKLEIALAWAVAEKHGAQKAEEEVRNRNYALHASKDASESKLRQAEDALMQCRQRWEEAVKERGLAASRIAALVAAGENVQTAGEESTAEIIAILAHHGQTYTGSPAMDYINHPAAVAASVPKHLKAIAWLHDVLEDSPLTIGHLLAAGIQHKTVSAVSILTRAKDQESYGTYINRIASSGNTAAIAVKIADIRYNLEHKCPDRLAKRYMAALPLLEAVLARMGGDSPGRK